MSEIWDSVNLYRVKKKDIELAKKAMAKAYFEADDEFPFTKSSRKMKFLEKLMGTTLNYTINHGYIFATSPNFEGVAAWLPSDQIFISNWQYIRSGILIPMILAGIGWLKRMKAYDKLCKKKHRENANFPHWYLYNLAVHPDHQNKGNASKLLTPILEILDNKKLACYLETSERNIPLYEHFGFHVVDKEHLKGLETEVWFMLRKNKEK